MTAIKVTGAGVPDVNGTYVPNNGLLRNEKGLWLYVDHTGKWGLFNGGSPYYYSPTATGSQWVATKSEYGQAPTSSEVGEINYTPPITPVTATLGSNGQINVGHTPLPTQQPNTAPAAGIAGMSPLMLIGGAAVLYFLFKD